MSTIIRSNVSATKTTTARTIEETTTTQKRSEEQNTIWSTREPLEHSHSLILSDSFNFFIIFVFSYANNCILNTTDCGRWWPAAVTDCAIRVRSLARACTLDISIAVNSVIVCNNNNHRRRRRHRRHLRCTYTQRKYVVCKRYPISDDCATSWIPILSPPPPRSLTRCAKCNSSYPRTYVQQSDWVNFVTLFVKWNLNDDALVYASARTHPQRRRVPR